MNSPLAFVRCGKTAEPAQSRIRLQCAWPLFICSFLVALNAFALPSARAADDDDNIQARLARMPRPWTEKVHRVTRKEYEATLEYWAEQNPKTLGVERVGVSAEGMGIHLLKITDATVADNDKQICLITSLHGGPERTGTTTILHLTEWLLGDSPHAAETRRRQIVLLMPINNPNAFFVSDRFGNANGIDPYTGGGPQNWDFKTMTYKALDKSPEVKAFLAVVDRYQPEMHADIHGIGLQEYPLEKLGDRSRYQGQTMFEVTGSAYSNYALRPWDWRVTEAIVAAGVKAGYPSDRFEADAQRAYWGPAMQPIANQLWRGRPNFYTAQYGYARYHTMLSAFEVGWEESGVARLKGLLDIGNKSWQDQPVTGYPVNRVKSLIGHYVTAWGRTAAERRQSRIELWQRQSEFSQGVLYPQTDGRDTYIVATTKEAAELIDSDPDRFIANIGGVQGMQAAAVGSFVNSGPEIKLYAEQSATARAAADPPIEHGIGLRLRIPYRKPELLDVRLNGRLLRKSPTDGYQSWFANGFTQLQINVPPKKARTTTLFAVTCAYAPDVKRSYGWKPPSEVVKRLETQTK